MHNKVQLFAPTGAFVATVQVPRFSMPPEVLIWGGRAFVLKAGRYVESFAYVVVGGAIAA